MDGFQGLFLVSPGSVGVPVAAVTGPWPRLRGPTKPRCLAGWLERLQLASAGPLAVRRSSRPRPAGVQREPPAKMRVEGEGWNPGVLPQGLLQQVAQECLWGEWVPDRRILSI